MKYIRIVFLVFLASACANQEPVLSSVKSSLSEESIAASYCTVAGQQGKVSIFCAALPTVLNSKLNTDLLARYEQGQIDGGKMVRNATNWQRQYLTLQMLFDEQQQMNAVARNAYRTLRSGDVNGACRAPGGSPTSADSSAWVYFVKAICSELQNQAAAALANYERAYAKQPDSGLYGRAYAESMQKQGDLEGAEKVLAQVLSLERSDAERHSSASRSALASTLRQQGVLYRTFAIRRLRDSQAMYAKAREAFGEALSLYQQLAISGAGDYKDDLAATLEGLAMMLTTDKAAIGQSSELYERALSIYRELAKVQPARYLPEVARILGNRSFALTGSEKADLQIRSHNEAIQILRDLENALPGIYAFDLAMHFDGLGVAYSQAGRSAESIDAYQRALALIEGIAKKGNAEAGMFRTVSLNKLILVQNSQNKTDEMLKSCRQLAALYNSGAAKNTVVVFPEVRTACTKKH